MKLPAPFSPASRFRLINIFVGTLLFLLFTAVLVAPPLHATSIATGSAGVTNLTITPSSGTVVFLSPWTAEAYAEAQNSTCGCDSQFTSSLGGIAQANAAVQFANGHSTADAANLILMASAGVNIPGGPMAASSVGKATLFNTEFEITGGTGQVDVTFSAMLSVMQSLLTDAAGMFAGSDTSFTLSVNGENVLSYDSFNQIGPNSSWSSSFSGELSNSIPLTFGQLNTVYAEVETDPYGYSAPEPPTAMLALGGAALGLIRRWILTKRG